MRDFHPKPMPKEILHAHPFAIKIDALRPCANGNNAVELPDSQKQYAGADNDCSAYRQKHRRYGRARIHVGLRYPFSDRQYLVLVCLHFAYERADLIRWGYVSRSAQHLQFFSALTRIL